MTSFQDKLDALPPKPEHIYAYGAQDEELAYYKARLALARELLCECREGFDVIPRSLAFNITHIPKIEAFLAKLDSEGI